MYGPTNKNADFLPLPEIQAQSPLKVNLIILGTIITDVVRPNKKLASKMGMERESKFIKMTPMGYGGTGSIEQGKESSFHVEYSLKDDTSLKGIEDLAFDSTLIIIDGVNILKEFPLEERKENQLSYLHNPFGILKDYQENASFKL